MNSLQYSNLAHALATLINQAQTNRQHVTLQLSISPSATGDASFGRTQVHQWENAPASSPLNSPFYR